MIEETTPIHTKYAMAYLRWMAHERKTMPGINEFPTLSLQTRRLLNERVKDLIAQAGKHSFMNERVS